MAAPPLVPVGLQAVRDAERPESAKKLIDHVHNVSLPPGAQAKVTGEWAVWSDFNASNEPARHLAELVSGLPTIILLLIAFAPPLRGTPLLLAIAGIAVGFGALNLLTHVTPMSVWAMNFSMMIGLAVGIDYSLFIVSRYREEREDGKDALDGIAATLATAGKAVFLSADRGPVARRGVRRAGHGVPCHGARDDPLRRRRGPRRTHAAPGAPGQPRRPRPVTRGTRIPTAG